MKRIYCLYRVSTKKQVDQQNNDIPMQKIACHEFAKDKGWIIMKEFYEKGISGYKVSVDNRDAIQELREAALNHEFDVLLVYMFDRLGRRDDETPFVVEWFVKQGIEVWSAQEGQQRFDTHTDKLLNYIRYWQATGESLKTSMRLKTRIAQLTAEGIYHGGTTPFGYRTVYKGRINKKGQPVRDLEIDSREAKYVKIIFDKTLNEGYGSYRMADYVNKLGIKTHSGSSFQCNTINRILKNRLYCGYYVSGDVISPKQEHLAIIDENVFDEVQKILSQRSIKNNEKQHIARTTKGKTLLSGNIYCAHCGSRLVASSAVYSYTLKDGAVKRSQFMRYSCYHKVRKLNDCDGQSVYSASKVDNLVLSAVKKYFAQITEKSMDEALEIRYNRKISEYKKYIRVMKAKKEKEEKYLKYLSLEVGKVIAGDSKLSVEYIMDSIEAIKQEITNTDTVLKDYNVRLERNDGMMNKLNYYYQQCVKWAVEFDSATLEQKKMIICQLIDEIDVGKGYEIDIKFNEDYGQFVSE